MKSNNNEILPQGYKMTELGPLPEEWEVVRLGEVAEYVNGYAFKPAQWKKKGLSIIRIQNLTQTTNEINYFDGKLDKKYLVKKGDILISWSASLGVFEWKRSDAWLNQHIFKVVNYSKKILKEYFYYAVMTKIEFMKNKTHGSTMHHITKKEFLTVKLPLPPLPQQQKIAAVVSAVQEAKEKTQAVIDATKALKKSMMKHLFTYGPVPLEVTENVPLKETEIGKVPEEWEVVKFGEVTEKTKQKDPRRDSNTEFKYVDVSAISNDALKITSYSEFLGKDAPHRARKAIQTDDIIFTTVRPYLKRIAIVPENLNGQIASTAFCVIRCKKQIVNPYYIFYTVGLDNFVNSVTENQRGSSYPAVTDKDILNQYVPLPPLPVQQKIASILSAIDAKIEAEENKKQALEELFKTLLDNLMTAKIRVNHLEVPS